MVDHTHALSFGQAAEAYDRYRPTYPAAAVTWAVGHPAPARVVDLGAGTGKLTRVLAGLGYDVVPVEPDARMRSQLAAAPGPTPLAGSAEQVPLPDGSVDAVVAGQAYHWFDPPLAHAEGARLLRPGGWYAAISNERDESVPWVAALTAITVELLGGRGARDDGPGMTGAHHPDLGPVQKAEFRHSVTFTPETLIGMISTRSYYITAAEERKRQVDAAIRDLVASRPELAGRESFALPYRTVVHRTRRR